MRQEVRQARDQVGNEASRWVRKVEVDEIEGDEGEVDQVIIG